MVLAFSFNAANKSEFAQWLYLQNCVSMMVVLFSNLVFLQAFAITQQLKKA